MCLWRYAEVFHVNLVRHSTHKSLQISCSRHLGNAKFDHHQFIRCIFASMGHDRANASVAKVAHGKQSLQLFKSRLFSHKAVCCDLEAHCIPTGPVCEALSQQKQPYFGLNGCCQRISLPRSWWRKLPGRLYETEAGYFKPAQTFSMHPAGALEEPARFMVQGSRTIDEHLHCVLKSRF